MPPNSQFDRAEPGNFDLDAAMARSSGPLLADPRLAATLMPPGRRAWFESFVARCLEQALLRSNPRALRDRQDLNRLWTSLAHDIAHHGVAVAVIGIIRLVHDADAKEDRRGWAWHASDQARELLQDRDIRDILESAVLTRDAALWARCPGWFGDSANAAYVRANAVRFLPHYTTETAWLNDLLDDETPTIRHFAAIHLGLVGPPSDRAKVRARLIEAAGDKDWVWSWKDHYASGRMGSDEARDLLDEGRPPTTRNDRP